MKSIANKESTVGENHRAEYFSPPPRSESECSAHKKTVNYFIKAP
jgi:hypothetical protein